VPPSSCATGRSSRSGVAPGCEADLVLLGGDPAKTVDAFADVRYTIRAGQVIDRAAAEAH
jgi:imidazolonepropionase-like amidohydrolase